VQTKMSLLSYNCCHQIWLFYCSKFIVWPEIDARWPIASHYLNGGIS